MKQKNVLYLMLLSLWVPLLLLDSSHIEKILPKGYLLTNIGVVIITFLLFFWGSQRLKVLMLLFIPFSTLGEFILSEWMDLYHYRRGSIPFYVPLGHAGVFASAWLIVQNNYTFFNRSVVKKTLTISIYISLAYVIFFLKDTLSLLLTLFFIRALHRKKYAPLYLVMSWLVIYLEIVGTYVGTWKWDFQQRFFTTINPPLGAIYFYTGGDRLIYKLAPKFINMRRKLHLRFQKITA